MNFEDDNLDYLLRRGGRRRKLSDDAAAQMPAQEIAISEPRHLVPLNPEESVPRVIQKLSQYPFAKQISFFSIMEIASQVGFITKVPEEVGSRLNRFLRRQDFLQFCKNEGEPLLLQKLRGRVVGKFERETPSNEMAAVFVQFSESSRRVEEDKDIGALVSFLRSGQLEKNSLDDLAAIFGDPNQLFPCFVQRKKPNPLRGVVLGIFKLRRFTSYLDSQLSEISDQKVLVRELWHYHDYWLSKTAIPFDEVLARIGNEMKRWIEPESKRSPSQFTASLIGGDLSADIGETNPLKGSIASVRRLLSGKYFA